MYEQQRVVVHIHGYTTRKKIPAIGSQRAWKPEINEPAHVKAKAVHLYDKSGQTPETSQESSLDLLFFS